MIKITKIRLISQLYFLAFSAILFYFFIINTLWIVHKVCPFSVICFGTLSIKSSSLIFPLSLLISGLFTLSAIWLGRYFCGFMCFFGTVQEFIYRLFHRNCRQYVKINYIDEKRLGFLKYIILSATIILIGFGLSRVYMTFCPVTALAWIQNITVYGIISLVIIFIMSALIERFWCRFLCPYAALLNIVQLIGAKLRIKRYVINRNLETCIDCNICNKSCPMNINLLEEETVDSVDCIKCFRCSEKCPKKGTLTSKRI